MGSVGQRGDRRQTLDEENALSDPENVLADVVDENNPLTETENPEELNRAVMLDERSGKAIEDTRTLDRPRPRQED